MGKSVARVPRALAEAEAEAEALLKISCAQATNFTV